MKHFPTHLRPLLVALFAACLGMSAWAGLKSLITNQVTYPSAAPAVTATAPSKVKASAPAIDYTAAGNYQLFWDGASGPATSPSNFGEINTDSPWGFYAYKVADGTYARFTKYDTSGSNNASNGTTWYTDKVYCFVSNTGHYHSTVDLSPAIVFTAPSNGIYYATITVWRDKDSQTNPMVLRSRVLKSEMQCDKGDYIFAKGYGTKAIDGVDGKQPQTLDFYIRLTAGQKFTFETESYTAGKNDGGRTHIADLSVASCKAANQPFTLEEAQAYDRFYDATVEEEGDGINYDAEGNYHLLWTEEGASVATAAAAFTKPADTPWGFYRYTVADGAYTAFASCDQNGKNGNGTGRGDAWYTVADEYCFVSSTGHFHATADASPAVMFTAPEDGIYFATITVFRDKYTESNTLYLRSHYLEADAQQCDNDNFIFEKAYGTVAVDGVLGQEPQTLDFFIRLKKDASFTFESYCDGNNSAARTHISDLAVATVGADGQPFTLEEAQAYDRFYDAVGEEETTEVTAQWIAKDQGYSNGEAVETAQIDDNITATFDKGTNNNAPKYYTTGEAVRAYGSNTITFTGGTISKIEFVFASGEGTNAISADNGTYEDGTWTGSAKSVTFTIGGTSGHRRIAGITVTYTSDGTEPPTPVVTVTAPVFTPEGGTYDAPQEVSITADEGCEIWYAIGKNDYQQYTAPFTVDETAIVSAYAKDADGNQSESVTAEYTIEIAEVISYANCQAANEAATEDGEAAELVLNDALVTYVNGKNAYVQDATGAILIYDKNNNITDLTVGDIVNGTVSGKLVTYHGLPEMTEPVIVVKPVSSGNDVVPTEVDAADLAANPLTYVSQYVVVKPATFATTETVSTKKNVNFTVGETALVLRNNFTVTFDVDKEKEYTVAGLVTIYDAAKQLYPTKADDVAELGAAADGTDLAAENAAAVESVTDGSYYRIFTEDEEGNKYYMTRDGHLTASESEGAKLHLNLIRYENVTVQKERDQFFDQSIIGFNFGASFSNPNTGTAEGAIQPLGHIKLDGEWQQRATYETQVLYLGTQSGKYAIRATNTSGARWGSNSYWTTTDTDADGLPEAEYGLTADYRWQLEETEAAEAENAAAAEAVTAGHYYRIFTQDATGATFFLKTDGYLTANEAEAALLPLNVVSQNVNLCADMVDVQAFKFGAKFTNPNCVSKNGAIDPKGHIIVGNQNRNDYEAQVFFLDKNTGKYAIRATAANSWDGTTKLKWNAHAFWTTTDTNADGLPEAEYSLNANYIWQLADANVMPENFPNPDATYTIKNADADFYMSLDAENDLTVLSEEPVEFSFEDAGDGTWYLTDGTNYLCFNSEKDYRLGAAADRKVPVTLLATSEEGKYIIKESKGVAGCDNLGDGERCYSDKKVTNHGFWIITEVVKPVEPVVFTKITSDNNLIEGEKYLMVYEDGNVALGAISTSKTPYGLPVEVEIADQQITITDQAVDVLTLVGSADEGWSFASSLDDGFLSWTSGNSLSLNLKADTDAKWLIEFDDDGNANIVNSNDEARNISYNTSNPRFATYGNLNQKRIQLYKAGEVAEPAEISAPVIKPGTGMYHTAQRVTITADEGAEIFYTLNDGEEQQYTAPFNVSETTTITAYAKVGKLVSEPTSVTINIEAGEAPIFVFNNEGDRTFTLATGEDITDLDNTGTVIDVNGEQIEKGIITTYTGTDVENGEAYTHGFRATAKVEDQDGNVFIVKTPANENNVMNVAEGLFEPNSEYTVTIQPIVYYNYNQFCDGIYELWEEGKESHMVPDENDPESFHLDPAWTLSAAAELWSNELAESGSIPYLGEPLLFDYCDPMPYYVDNTPHTFIIKTDDSVTANVKALGTQDFTAFDIWGNNITSEFLARLANGTATGISKANAASASDKIFNIAGQRVSKATKGVFILNGKKVAVK